MVQWISVAFGFLFWLLFIFLTAIAFIILISINMNPFKARLSDDLFDYRREIEVLPSSGYYFDTHSHTSLSDGIMTTEQNIMWHIANGFNAMVLTDHNTGGNNKELLKLQPKYPNILLIPGYEWTTATIHLNFLGIEDYPYNVPASPSEDEIKQAIENAHSLGAIVQVNHISWTLNEPLHRSGVVKHPSRQQLIDWGVDGFEINNSTLWYDQKTVHYLENHPQSRPIYQATGTDIHNPLLEYATGWTQILFNEGETPSWETIKWALLEARTRLWLDHDYYQPPESVKLHTRVSGFMKRFPILFAIRYGSEKVTMNQIGVSSLFLFSIVTYIPFRVLLWVLQTL